jgi:hypothetical protein
MGLGGEGGAYHDGDVALGRERVVALGLVLQ